MGCGVQESSSAQRGQGLAGTGVSGQIDPATVQQVLGNPVPPIVDGQDASEGVAFHPSRVSMRSRQSLSSSQTSPVSM